MSTTPTTTRTDVFAQNERRIEGHEKVSGRLQYTADVRRPNPLWAAFAISPIAYGRIRNIDATAARALPGVRAVLTAADIGQRRVGRNLYDWPVLCYDVVRFIGDRVAAVAADTREIAEQAAALIEVDYEELPANVDAREALRPDAPVLHPDRDSYYFKAFAGKEPPKRSHPNIQGTAKYRKGEDDLSALFASAHKVFEHHFVSPRQHAGYIEPRSTVVWIDDPSSGSGQATVHVVTPNKQPFNVREQMSNVTGVPKEKIVVEPSGIGGDFGGKGMTVDEFACYYLAKATGRPVRFVETYTDELRAATTRHRAHVTLKTAVDAQGNLIAHHSTVLLNGGAYAGGKPSPQLLPSNGYALVPYQIPNVAIDITNVYTNTLPTAHVCSPMAGAIYFCWEQHIDLIAEALGIDKLEYRLRTCVKDGDMFPTKEKIRQHNAELVLQTLRKEAKWGTPVPANRGRGLALVSWHVGGGKTSVKCTLRPDGTVDVLTGVPEQGAGAHTVVQRIAAATLGTTPDAVTVTRGATDEALDDPGAGASRVTHIVGGATEVAALALRAKITEATGAAWQDDRFVDAAGKTVDLKTLAKTAAAGGPLTVAGTYDGNHGADHAADFNFVALCVDVDADPETGAFKIADVVLVADVGRIINPIGHQGQIDGGLVYGIGNAMMEEMPIDESGKVTTLSLGEYKLPTFMDIPPFRTVLVSAGMGEGPYGAKAAGELGNIGVPGAVANAVAAALGVRVYEFPVTSERIFSELSRREIPA
jgi:CO/xanthine dehydrogenase Mo-binding subunit